MQDTSCPPTGEAVEPEPAWDFHSVISTANDTTGNPPPGYGAGWEARSSVRHGAITVYRRGDEVLIEAPAGVTVQELVDVLRVEVAAGRPLTEELDIHLGANPAAVPLDRP